MNHPEKSELDLVHVCAYIGRVWYEWDPEKAIINRQKHRVSFADAVAVFEDEYAVNIPDTDADEERFAIIGTDAFGVVLTVVYCWRGEQTIRVISARKATLRERRAYGESHER